MTDAVPGLPMSPQPCELKSSLMAAPETVIACDMALVMIRYCGLAHEHRTVCTSLSSHRACVHVQGLFVPQNYTAAKEQFEQAAAKGLSSAHNGLGVLAWNGQVRRWFREARTAIGRWCYVEYPGCGGLLAAPAAGQRGHLCRRVTRVCSQLLLHRACRACKPT